MSKYTATVYYDSSKAVLKREGDYYWDIGCSIPPEDAKLFSIPADAISDGRAYYYITATRDEG